jgi:recombinational DNA repair protein RecR
MAEKKDEKEKEKKHVCSICGRPSDATICHACEDKIRGEAIEKKHDIDKAGRTDSGRR